MQVLLPFALLVAVAWQRRRFDWLAALALIALLLAAPIDYKTYSGGWEALLDYPRLYAGTLVFIGLFVAARADAPRTPLRQTTASQCEPDDRGARGGDEPAR